MAIDSALPQNRPERTAPVGEAESRARVGQIGQRLRTLRIAAGLTQSELAGGRFTKEYVSQIERGKTRPTAGTLAWLGSRLGVDSAYIEHGVSGEDRDRVEAALARAEALLEAHRYDEARAELARARPSATGTGATELELRALLAESWAHIRVGSVREALGLLARAQELAEAPGRSDLDRAAVLFRLGVCRLELSSISTALALFDEALALADRSGLPCDPLRVDILGWRARCHRRQRDWEAAREDVELALELAQADDRRTTADTYFQASLAAEREGHWLLARTCAERARGLYEELDGRAEVGRLMNDLGGLSSSLGCVEKAVDLLGSAYEVALEIGDAAEAGKAMSSLAEVRLRAGDPAGAEGAARTALELLRDRDDCLNELGIAQLTMGRALLELDRLNEAEESLLAADASFEQLSSVSHRAAAWVAQGDLAHKRGADPEAARLYRRAAEALQDFRF